MDSVLKMVGSSYITLFSQNICETFCVAYEQVDPNTRKNLQVVLRTWQDGKIFSSSILDKIESRISALANVHVNPDFVKTLVGLFLFSY